MSIPTQRMIDIGNLGGPQHSNRNAACNPEKKNHGKCRSTSHRMWYTQETNPTWGWFILGFFHVPNGSKFSNRFQRDVIQKWTSGNQVTNFRSHRRPWLRFFSPLQSNQTSCNGKSTIYRWFPVTDGLLCLIFHLQMDFFPFYRWIFPIFQPQFKKVIKTPPNFSRCFLTHG